MSTLSINSNDNKKANITKQGGSKVNFNYFATYKKDGKTVYVGNPREASTNFEFINEDILFEQKLYGVKKWCISETTMHRETVAHLHKRKGIKQIDRSKVAFL